VASDSEEILDDSMYRPESLRMSHRFEPSHLPLALADRFVADDNPTLGQKIFKISEAQAEAVVEPDGMTDNFRRKSVSAIAGLVGCHT